MEYRPNETERLVADPMLRRNASDVSIRCLAKAARVSDATVKALRRGKRLRRSTLRKLATALKSLPKTR